MNCYFMYFNIHGLIFADLKFSWISRLNSLMLEHIWCANIHW